MLIWHRMDDAENLWKWREQAILRPRSGIKMQSVRQEKCDYLKRCGEKCWKCEHGQWNCDHLQSCGKEKGRKCVYDEGKNSCISLDNLGWGFSENFDKMGLANEIERVLAQFRLLFIKIAIGERGVLERGGNESRGFQPKQDTHDFKRGTSIPKAERSEWWGGGYERF